MRSTGYWSVIRATERASGRLPGLGSHFQYHSSRISPRDSHDGSSQTRHWGIHFGFLELHPPASEWEPGGNRATALDFERFLERASVPPLITFRPNCFTQVQIRQSRLNPKFPVKFSLRAAALTFPRKRLPSRRSLTNQRLQHSVRSSQCRMNQFDVLPLD
jgi:hypothetical protein